MILLHRDEKKRWIVTCKGESIEAIEQAVKDAEMLEATGISAERLNEWLNKHFPKQNPNGESEK